MIRIDDILAALILSLFMFRRLEVVTIQSEDNPHLPPAKLEAWRQFALNAYTVGASVCAAKVVLSLGWFWLFQSRPGWLIAGGLTIFVGWVITLVWCWRQTTEANALRVDLQIQRRPPPKKRA
jgi:type VI protein secretion system component VasK